MSEDIILRTERLEGVDKTLFAYEQFQSVPIVKTKVTIPMYKSENILLIGTKEKLNVDEVIEVGDYKIKYRVVSFRKMTIKGGLYRIKRVDGANATQLDLDGATKGKKVTILNRNTDYFKRLRLKL